MEPVVDALRGGAAGACAGGMGGGPIIGCVPGGNCAPFFQKVTETMPLARVTVVGWSVRVTGAEFAAWAKVFAGRQKKRDATARERPVQFIAEQFGTGAGALSEEKIAGGALRLLHR
jgi:hypothetical protein